jgi:nucleoside-diphosphate-sugar epimerase
VREARPHTVLHLAARGATDPFLPLETALRHNLHGSLNLMRACFEGEDVTTQRLIMARTPGELGAINTYAASKAAVWPFAQLYAHTHGWPIVGGMIFQCYGEGQPAQTLIPAAVRSALAGENFPMTSGQQTRDFIYVGDVVAGLMAAVSAPHLPAGETLELGTGVATSLLAVVAQIYALVGREGRPLPNTLPERAGERPQPIANLAHTQQWLAWHPHDTLATGLAQVIGKMAERLTD